MTVTVFSFLMSILWCSVFTLLSCVLFRRKRVLVFFSVYALLFLMMSSLLRLIVSIEPPFVHIIRSTKVFPAVMAWLASPFPGLPAGGQALTMGNILLILWAAGSMYALWRFIYRERRFHRLMSGEKPSDDPRLLLAMEKIAGDRAKNISVIKTPLTDTPMIAGIIRPAIYLPDLPLADKDLYHVLAHEWAHYIHKDLWCKLVVRILCVIYWWNPFIYLLRNNIDEALEIKSDLYVTKRMAEEEKLAYLETILLLARSFTANAPAPSPTGIGFLSQSPEHPLKQRFHCVLNRQPPGRLQRAANGLLLLAMLVLFAFSYVFVIQPANNFPVEYENGEVFNLTSVETFLVPNEDGTYSLYINNAFTATINDISKEPFSTMKIIRLEE